jgi:hypothetical protein
VELFCFSFFVASNLSVLKGFMLPLSTHSHRFYAATKHLLTQYMGLHILNFGHLLMVGLPKEDPNIGVKEESQAEK